MGDKEISMLPATDGVTDDTLIPVYQPGATEPAQRMNGKQFAEFAVWQVQEDLDELSEKVSQLSEEIGDLAQIDEEQISQAVNEWLDEHPEATTTVEDGSITVEKLADDVLDALTKPIEPAEDDIPKVFFGGALQQTKDEVVVPFRYISKTEDISGYAEIKAQGNSSMSYPKKNQTVKMFKDAACSEKLKVDFKGWGKQNKHCYKANWIDLTHARNVVSARLWADVVKSRSNYAELPELYRNSPNQGAVDGFPVKVYANGVYQGRYTLNIPKDKWMANMDDDLDEHCILCGEGYNSGCFREATTKQWTDEIHDTMPTSIKARWVEFINFVMNSTDEEFKANLSNYFYVDSLIDYHLYGLQSCGLDAYGKNQLYMTYDGQKWIACMYDMDSTWGLYWNGSKILAADYGRDKYEDMVSDRQGNLLFIRLEQLFGAELQKRWAELKAGALSIPNIINRFERFTDIAPVELVAEDYADTTGSGSFTGIPSQTTNSIQQIRAFAVARQAWADEYIANLVYLPCTGITLSATKLTFTTEGTQTLTATVTPDGCTDAVVWESDNSSIATVNDGVVTAVANGSATITARCGNYSATCTVAVSGIAEPVPCTSVVLSETTIAFSGLGATKTLIATVEPADTTDSVIWTSSNDAIAIVANGVVTSISEGDCTITATCGSCSASCEVSIAIPEIPEGANVLKENYSPDGEPFVLYNGAFDLNTQKIVAKIDLTSCVSANEIILSIGDTEENIAKWNQSGVTHLLYSAGGNRLTVRVSSSTAYTAANSVGEDAVLFELSADGIKVDGVTVEHVNMETHLDAIKAFTNIVIGSTQGTTRSNAKYEYIYIMDV